MKKLRNVDLRKTLLSFSKSAISTLLLKHRKGLTLNHISGAEAEIDDDGCVITPAGSYKRSDNVELNYFIITHGDLPDYLDFIKNYWDDLKNSSEFQLCKTEMEHDVKVSRHLGTIVGALGRAATHDAEFFVQQFLYQLLSHLKGIRWDEQSFSELYENLEHFFYTDYIQYTAFAAIWGFHRWSDANSSKWEAGISGSGAVIGKKRVEPTSPVKLTKRATIIPAEASSIHKYFFVEGGFRPPVLGHWDFPYILELFGSTRKYFRGSTRRKVIPAHQQLEEEISRILGAIRLFKMGDIQFKLLGHTTHDWFRRVGMVSMPSPNRPIIHTAYDINSDEEKELGKFCKWFTGMKQNDSLELAMNRFNLSYERNQFKDSLIDQMIAFEALLIQSEYRQIGKTLSRRVANLISDSVEGRQSVYDEIYDAYYIRSKIVHGDQNNEIRSILESKKKIHIWYVRDIQELLRMTIRKYGQLVKEGQSKIDIINNHDRRISGSPKRV